MSELDNRIRSWPIEDAYVNAIQGFNPRLDDDLALLIARAILSFSHDTGIDPRLVIALVEAESAFNPRATSTKGAMGLGQLMPATAKSFGIRDPYEPVQNIYVCVSYLERDFYRFQGKANILDLVLAAYNAGPGAVRKYGGVPPYRETQNYVRKVKSLYAKLAG
ncbi:lytic transglycosylase domain-containing protein [bacterium]|nr:lytic transglycosylase domain-containing protein [bacterium]